MSQHQQEYHAPVAQRGRPDPPSRSISRRAVVGGLVGLTGVAALGGGVVLWKYRQSHTALYTYTARDGEIRTVAWSPDGKRIASKSFSREADSLHIWDAFTGQHVVSGPDQHDTMGEVAWSPNSQLLASANPDYLVVHILRASDGAILLTYPHNALQARFKQIAVAWSPDGKRLASAGDQVQETYSLQSWDALTDSRVITYESSFRAETLWSLAWSPNGKYLASVGVAFDIPPHNNVQNFLQVWDAQTGKSVFLSPLLGDFYSWITSCSWSADSQRVVMNFNNTAQVWDISKQKLLYTYKGHATTVLTVAWSPNGKYIASGSKDVQFWNAETGELTFSYYGHSDAVRSLSWSPDSKYIASGGSDKTVQVWMPQ